MSQKPCLGNEFSFLLSLVLLFAVIVKEDGSLLSIQLQVLHPSVGLLTNGSEYRSVIRTQSLDNLELYRESC